MQAFLVFNSSTVGTWETSTIILIYCQTEIADVQEGRKGKHSINIAASF